MSNHKPSFLRINLIDGMHDYNSFQLLKAALSTGLSMREMQKTMHAACEYLHPGVCPKQDVPSFGMGGTDPMTYTHYLFCAGVDFRNKRVTFDIHC